MDDIIDYINYWHDNKKITTYLNMKNCMLFDTEHYINISDENDNVLSTYKLPQTRVCLGVLTFPENNTYVYIHYNFIDDDRSLIIDIYSISNENIFTKTNQILVKSDFSCNNLSSQVYKSINNSFIVIWSDLFNYDFVKYILVEKDKIIEEKEISNIYDIEKKYFLSRDTIFESLVSRTIETKTVETNNNINIGLLINEKPFYELVDISLPYEFKNEFEIESTIIDIDLTDGKLLFLVRVNLQNNIDVLHIDSFYIDLLIDIHSENVVMISDKKKSDIKPSIKENTIWYGFNS